ncbi:MAG: hypothetical protein QXS42_00420 [Zestosphaera sp.]
MQRECRERTHAVSVCREKCAEYPFSSREEFEGCVESCVRETIKHSRH